MKITFDAIAIVCAFVAGLSFATPTSAQETESKLPFKLQVLKSEYDKKRADGLTRLYQGSIASLREAQAPFLRDGKLKESKAIENKIKELEKKIAALSAGKAKAAPPAGRPGDAVRALLKKLGPHAPEGTRLATDNKAAFELYFQSAAKQLREIKKGEAPADQELFGLMCIPTAYGWPESRSFNRDTKYTGVIPIFETGEYEVTMDTWPATEKAAIVLEIDGEPPGKVMHPNQEVRVNFHAGVRTLTVRTDDDVQLQFRKLRVKRVPKSNG